DVYKRQEMGRWGDGEMGKWGDKEIYIVSSPPSLPTLPSLPSSPSPSASPSLPASSSPSSSPIYCQPLTISVEIRGICRLSMQNAV
ncbi:hypothetical protein ACN4EK_09705, partial [Pantanalinema rosaneae CENA516]|uniref:hypothetical protein n=1 Tax=Pantanalinema rosaneae TaxID=1620701 RepID=UPI003D6F41E4